MVSQRDAASQHQTKEVVDADLCQNRILRDKSAAKQTSRSAGFLKFTISALFAKAWKFGENNQTPTKTQIVTLSITRLTTVDSDIQRERFSVVYNAAFGDP